MKKDTDNYASTIAMFCLIVYFNMVYYSHSLRSNVYVPDPYVKKSYEDCVSSFTCINDCKVSIETYGKMYRNEYAFNLTKIDKKIDVLTEKIDVIRIVSKDYGFDAPPGISSVQFFHHYRDLQETTTTYSMHYSHLNANTVCDIPLLKRMLQDLKTKRSRLIDEHDAFKYTHDFLIGNYL